jgi:hypothetical protein
MQKLKIKSITKLPSKMQVYDLNVNDTHNFFIGESEILTHNCDYLSINAQAILRGVIEQFSSTVRFILTCNYPNKIIPALHSRCQGFHIDELDHTEFTARVATVLVTENIDFDLETLDDFVRVTYPDLRKCLNSCQTHSTSGKLISTTSNDSSTDYKLEMVELFKAGKISEARKLICAQARPDEIEEIFVWLYNNLDLISKTETGQDDAIMIIRQGLVNHALVSDPEINLSATLVELARI